MKRLIIPGDIQLWFCRLFAVVALILMLNQTAMAGTPKHVSYEEFSELVRLCPNVKDPRLPNVTDQGFELFRKHQMRVSEQGVLVTGPLDQSGNLETALLFKGTDGQHLVIAKKSGSTYAKVAHFHLQKPSESLTWNGKALVLSKNRFIAWTGTEFKICVGSIASYAFDREASDLRDVQIKLTYVGAQTEPYPGLLISSPYSLPDLAQFKVHRSKGVHYGNDDLGLLWHVTLTAKELQGFFVELCRDSVLFKAEDRTGTEGGVCHSLSVSAKNSLAMSYCELFLTCAETNTLLKRYGDQLEKTNGTAAYTMKEYSKMFGG